MGYEILKDDLGELKSSKKSKTNKVAKLKGIFNVNPMYIHIALILIIICLLFLYFVKDLQIGVDDIKKQEMITLIGDLEEFNQNYSGNLKIETNNFKLETPSGEFDGLEVVMNIENFSGLLYLDSNNTIRLDGIAKRIQYGKNKINLDGSNFKFSSNKKITMDLYFNNISLDFNTGKVKVGEGFNYDFEKSNIKLSDFNNTFSYDGTFLFTGYANKLVLESQNPKFIINYFQG